MEQLQEISDILYDIKDNIQDNQYKVLIEKVGEVYKFIKENSGCKCGENSFCSNYQQCANFIQFSNKFPVLKLLFQQQQINLLNEPRIGVIDEDINTNLELMVKLSGVMNDNRSKIVVIICMINYVVGNYQFVLNNPNFRVAFLEKVKLLVYGRMGRDVIRTMNPRNIGKIWLKIFSES